MGTREYIVYADESLQKGEFYSNFYGGAIVSSQDLATVTTILEHAKQEQNLFQEIKWSKVTEQYLDKYVFVTNAFFDLIAEGESQGFG